MKRLFAIVLFVAFAATAASALEVRQVVWGFDGKTLPHRINPVSVEIYNPSDKPFEGFLDLHRTIPMVGRVGERNVTPLFLSPRSSKWMQFYVYVGDNETWMLSWGAGAKNAFPLPAPTAGAPARVMLTTGAQLTARGPRMKTFPDFLFPPSVTAMDGLHSLVMDLYPPKWEEVRETALLDWVRRGGVLHLLNTPSGKPIEFPQNLSVLNTPLEKFQVGNGLVVRHNITAREVSDEWLNERGYTMPALSKLDDVNFYGGMRLEDRLLDQVSAFTQPTFQWAMIYLMAFLYVVLIGPVNFVVGRRVRDYRWSLAFLVGCVALFMFIFNLLGHGYGNQSAAHTLAYVRPLGDGNADVTQWSNVFAARSGQFELTHRSAHNIYATCQQYEPVNGVTFNGKDGKFVVDIPLNTSRSFLHRGKIKCEAPRVTVREWDATNHLRALRLDLKMPEGVQVEDAWVYFNGRIYRLFKEDGQLSTLKTQAGMSPDEFVSAHEMHFGMNPRWGGDEETEKPLERFRRMARAVVARTVGSPAFAHSYEETMLARDRAQVFLFTQSLNALDIAHEDFVRQVSYSLFHIQLFDPQKIQ
jgi:hypothetical protein